MDACCPYYASHLRVVIWAIAVNTRGTEMFPSQLLPDEVMRSVATLRRLAKHLGRHLIWLTSNLTFLTIKGILSRYQNSYFSLAVNISEMLPMVDLPPTRRKHLAEDVAKRILVHT